jgi:hypothetical protein
MEGVTQNSPRMTVHSPRSQQHHTVPLVRKETLCTWCHDKAMKIFATIHDQAIARHYCSERCIELDLRMMRMKREREEKDFIEVAEKFE